MFQNLFNQPWQYHHTLPGSDPALPVIAGVMMRHLGLGLLLRVIAIVPLLALAAFGGILVKQSYDEYRDITHVAALQRLASAAAAFSSGIPRESGLSYPYLASGSDADRAKMLAQRPITEQA